MRSRPIVLVAVTLVCATALLAACGGGSDDDASGGASSEAVVGVFTAGDSISVAVGTTFVVELEANPTTGYAWVAADNPNATFVKSEQVRSSTLPGAPGMQRLTFEATARGSSTLVLDYERSFESGVPPVQTESFPLTVT